MTSEFSPSPSESLPSSLPVLPDDRHAWRDRFTMPEVIFAAHGIVISASLLWVQPGSILTGMAIGLTAAYLLGVVQTRPVSRPRILVNYVSVWFLYTGSSVVIEALRLPIRDHWLLAVDRGLFGETPAVRFQHAVPRWLNDVLGLAYLSYHVYLHWTLLDVFFDTEIRRRVYSRLMFTAFGLGFAGYYLVPAPSLTESFPELFDAPISGGACVVMTQAVVAKLAARYDAFPSLHIFITASLLYADWHQGRRRFCIMLAPSILMVFATILLRYHYAIDVLTSFALLVPFLCAMRVSFTSPSRTACTLPSSGRQPDEARINTMG